LEYIFRGARFEENENILFFVDERNFVEVNVAGVADVADVADASFPFFAYSYRIIEGNNI